MLGVIYLLLCFAAGYVVCSMIFPKLSKAAEQTFRKENIYLPKAFVLLPAWFAVGTLLVTWLTYFAGYLFREREAPLLIANLIVIPFIILFVGIGSLILYRKNTIKKEKKGKKKEKGWKNVIQAIPLTIGEAVFLFLVIFLAFQLMWRTFYIKDGELGVGLSVFSDFAPHLGMIRSFSYGNNFPTQYAHFAGADIRYHFMFQFLVGNLEFLGMRLDAAFNIPSILSLIGTFLLLYVLAVKLTKKREVGYFSVLFFIFRSSPSFFGYIKDLYVEQKSIPAVVTSLKDNIEFIGKTPNETWGLWNLNVYCNQRHLAFSLIILLLALLLFLPLFYEQMERISKIIKEKWKAKHTESKTEQTEKVKHTESKIEQAEETIEQQAKEKVKYPKTFIVKTWFLASFFTKEGWKIKDFKLAVGAGIVLGALAFFNGAVLIAALSILFVTAICSDRRLELLCTAVIATGLSLLQSAFFVNGSVVSPTFQFGFIAENKTIGGVFSYIIALTGIFFFVLFVSLLFQKNRERYLAFAFSIPFLMAFTISLTVDVTVNHKSIMLALMLLGIFAADIIVKLFSNRRVILKGIAVVLVVILIATGVYDYRTVIERNAPEKNLYYNLNDELLVWIKKNTSSKDIFLTANYYLNNMVLGGAMLYFGWPYYAWSAGYDTNYRGFMVKRMYEADTSEELMQLVEQEQIRYIVVDNTNRTTSDYILNEENIDRTFDKIYESGEGAWMVSIYDTQCPKVMLQ